MEGLSISEDSEGGFEGPHRRGITWSCKRGVVRRVSKDFTGRISIGFIGEFRIWTTKIGYNYMSRAKSNEVI
jgi:hypothetical protein